MMELVKLKAADVKERVKIIKMNAADPETAHGMEDCLYQDVLAAIRDGVCEDPVACCKAALEAIKIPFPRWCA
jgi:hypothetical protein